VAYELVRGVAAGEGDAARQQEIEGAARLYKSERISTSSRLRDCSGDRIGRSHHRVVLGDDSVLGAFVQPREAEVKNLDLDGFVARFLFAAAGLAGLMSR